MLSDLLHSSTQSFGSPEAEKKKRKKTQGPARSKSVCQIDAPIGPTSTCTNAPGIKTLKLKEKKQLHLCQSRGHSPSQPPMYWFILYMPCFFELPYLGAASTVYWPGVYNTLHASNSLDFAPVESFETKTLDLLKTDLGPKRPRNTQTKLMEEIRLYNQLRLVVYSIIYKVFYIPGG